MKSANGTLLYSAERKDNHLEMAVLEMAGFYSVKIVFNVLQESIFKVRASGKLPQYQPQKQAKDTNI